MPYVQRDLAPADRCKGGIVKVGEKKETAYQIGAVVVFPIGTTPQEAREALELLRPFKVSVSGPRQFDPAYGHPVFYIP